MPDGSGRQHILLRFNKSCVVFESRCMCILSRLLAWPPEVDGWLLGVCALEKGQRTQYYERNEYDYGHKLLKIAEAFLGLR
jgi:hypothetical protein